MTYREEIEKILPERAERYGHCLGACEISISYRFKPALELQEQNDITNKLHNLDIEKLLFDKR